jgi:hypothetical protein
MRDARKPADEGVFRTVRYQEGGAEKIERAQVLEQQCGRTVLRTLRGWLLSVPAQVEAASATRCEEGAWR